MKTKTIGFICLAFVLVLGTIGFYNAQESKTEVQPPDLRTRISGSDWDRFLGPTGDAKSPETSLLTSWSPAGPRVVWEQEIGTSYGAPTIAQGRLFMFDRHGGFARLTCMKSETGDELWRFEYPTDYEDLYGYNNGPRTCPVVDGNRAYIFGPKGMLHCISVSDGKPLWSVDTTIKFHVVQNFFGVGSAPIVEAELLIVQIGGSPPGGANNLLSARSPVQGNSSGIVAFNKWTGEVVYQITDELASYTTPTLATINDRRWCFTFARGGLVGFEPCTGTVDFHYPWRSKKFESVNASNPVVVDDLVFISETYGLGSSLLKVRPGGYKVVWKDSERRRNKAMQLHWNTAIHHKGYLYGYSGRHSRGCELRCVELRTGKIIWSHRVDERGSLLYADGHFISLGEFGTLTLIRPTPKKLDVVSQVLLTDEHGEQRIKYPAWAAPVLSNGFLYLRGKDRLVCLDLIFRDE